MTKDLFPDGQAEVEDLGIPEGHTNILGDLLLKTLLSRFHFIDAGKNAQKPVLTGIVGDLRLIESATTIRRPHGRSGHNPVLNVGDAAANLARNLRLAESGTCQR